MTYRRPPSDQLRAVRRLPPGPPLVRDEDWALGLRALVWVSFRTAVIVAVLIVALSVAAGVMR